MSRRSASRKSANDERTDRSAKPAHRSPRVSGERATGSPETIPPGLPRQPYRPAQANIPNDKQLRDALRALAAERVERARLVPPLTVEELRAHAVQICQQAGADRIYADYVAIMVNNEAWCDAVAGIPYDRRLLLLPQCMRAIGHCEAPIDEFGLVCQGCGQCLIHHLQSEAERLGYAVLVAEGSAVVTKLIEMGKIEAIVGVSCMSVLEKCFPHMEARAVPGIAIPLLQDGCANTSVDLDWVWDAIHLNSEDRLPRLDLDALKRDVQNWFAEDALNALLGTPMGQTEAIACDWLARAGKRWRPYLTACVHLSLNDDTGEQSVPPDDLKKLAIAVECFHKASLIHDDIEDDDDERYGRQALHVEHGTPVALNVGDYLLGEGYRLIAELDVDAETKAAMLHTAATGHRTLSLGQGAELWWTRHPRPLWPIEVLDIFRQKTAPAFEVALRLGAYYAGVENATHAALTQYSDALGVAYQIRDDLEDFAGPGDSNDLRDMRLSAVLAVAHARAVTEVEKELTTALWNRAVAYDDVAEAIERLIARRDVLRTVEDLLDTYTSRAIQSLHSLTSPALKVLLRRVIGRIFGNEPIRGYCREFEARHAANRSAGPEPAA